MFYLLILLQSRKQVPIRRSNIVVCFSVWFFSGVLWVSLVRPDPSRISFTKFSTASWPEGTKECWYGRLLLGNLGSLGVSWRWSRCIYASHWVLLGLGSRQRRSWSVPQAAGHGCLIVQTQNPSSGVVITRRPAKLFYIIYTRVYALCRDVSRRWRTISALSFCVKSQ